MEAFSNLGRVVSDYSSTKDCITIVKHLAGIPGGRTLDVSAFDGVENIFAGHVICEKEGAYYPLPVADDAYVALTKVVGEQTKVEHTPVGVLKHTIRTADPRAAIMTMGQVNAASSPYEVTAEIKAALPRIEFLN